MSEGTFQIATTLDGKVKREYAYVDSFEAHGHTWVVHRKIYGVCFGVSHGASGYALPKIDAVSAEEAKAQGIAYLDANALQIPKVIAEVMK